MQRGPALRMPGLVDYLGYGHAVNVAKSRVRITGAARAPRKRALARRIVRDADSPRLYWSSAGRHKPRLVLTPCRFTARAGPNETETTAYATEEQTAMSTTKTLVRV